MSNDFLAISALQHYAYCPRQFALIHVEQAWEENRFTAEGKVLHQRVDSGLSETRKGIRTERGVLLQSLRYKITGKMDLLEIEVGSDKVRYTPVEYKRGKHKVQDWDRIQLCAQALCLEEMRGVRVERGAIWYWQERKREKVDINQVLRQQTISIINAARKLVMAGETPKPVYDGQHCRACSLADLCQPETFCIDQSAGYIDDLFKV